MKLTRAQSSCVFAMAMGIALLFDICGMAALAQKPVAEFDAAFIQEQIDAAQVGEVIELPEGIIRGSLVLRADVSLRGKGIGKTIIDGSGAEVVIRGASRSMVTGCTITGGRVGIDTQGRGMGIFDNRFTRNRDAGVIQNGGASVIIGNLFDYHRQSIGVWLMGGYAHVIGNDFSGLPMGVECNNAADLWLTSNTFTKTRVGVALHHDSQARGGANLWEQVPFHVHGGTIETVEGLETIDEMIHSARSFEQRVATVQNSMRAIADEATRLTYTLSEEPGYFRVNINYPKARFRIEASSEATSIREYQGLDQITREALEMRLETGEREALRSDAVMDSDYQPGRYAMDAIFEDHGSYRLAEGKLYFTRSTSLSTITIVLPAHFYPTRMSHPFELRREGTRCVLALIDFGRTDIELVCDYMPDKVAALEE